MVDDTEKSDYATAVQHYLSPDRRDSVKANWEEPFSCRLYSSAVERLGLDLNQRPIRVLDLGCGTGDGYRLLQEALSATWKMPQVPMRYVGIDNSAEMLAAAQSLLPSGSSRRFIEGDIRDALPVEPFDLYFSSGVACSHLSECEMSDLFSEILARIRHNGSSSAVIIDVLGRYSIEWTPNWQEPSWLYNMSFFSSDDPSPEVPMTFYAGSALSKLLVEAVAESECRLRGIELHDRSIVVGRHTVTQTYNPGLSPYRDLVNSLLDPATATSLQDLLFSVDTDSAPADVRKFFSRFSMCWNTIVESARRNTESILNRAPSQQLLERSAAQISSERHKSEVRLANDLRCLEERANAGLGVGHTLIAIVHVEGAE